MSGSTTADRGAPGRTGEAPGRETPPEPPRGRRERLRALPGRLLGRLRRGLTRPRRILLGILTALAVAGFTVWVLYGSGWLRAEHVRVAGNDVLTEQQVLDAARLPMGDPMASVDTDAVESRLLEELPRLDAVDVGRSWPHGLTVDVAERRAVLLVREKGRYTEVDRQGVRFASVEKAPHGVPVLQLETASSPSLRRFPESRLVREAVTVAGSLPQRLASETRLLKVSSYDGFSLDLSGGRTVDWGSSEKSESKARALNALLKAAPKASNFDVSVPTAPASSGS